VGSKFHRYPSEGARANFRRPAGPMEAGILGDRCPGGEGPSRMNRSFMQLGQDTSGFALLCAPQVSGPISCRKRGSRRVGGRLFVGSTGL